MKFSTALQNSEKKDSHVKGIAAKVSLRAWVLENIGKEKASVFDAFAGSGVMFRSVWAEAASYCGCDEKFFRDRRPAFVADNLRVLRVINLSRFNIFDLDAYGSPWSQAWIIATRRGILKQGEKIGFVTTDGGRMKSKMGTPPFDFAFLTGCKGSGAYAQWDTLTGKAFNSLAKKVGGRVIEARTSQRRDIFYSACIIGAAGPEERSDNQEGENIANPS